MDLSRLTRPAILCQCSRCSSSLAALENEWAKLSTSYSIAAGWLSVELHRISISSEKKQIPQSSDLSLIRGRIIQEIGCKLCQQKLGVLCALDNGPNIFWKMSKVSFREIVTMRTVEPSFKDGVLESLLFPAPSEPSIRQDGTPTTHLGALVPAGADDSDRYNTSMEQQIQHHGLSLNHISSSVNNLHDTMSELKQSFTALRIELNGPNRIPNDIGNITTGEFNMITTVLKELKLKSEEIEKLKLEIEALKLRNRYMEEQVAKQPLLPPVVQEALPEVGTPGLLQRGRKRPFSEQFQSGRNQPIADSFEDDDDDDDQDSMGDFSLEDRSIPPIKIPLKRAVPDLGHEQVSRSPSLQIAVGPSTYHTPLLHSLTVQNGDTNMQQQPVVKRRRLSHSADRPPSSGTISSEKKKPGRPRKSISQGTKPDISQTPKSTPLSEQNVNVGNNAHRDQLPSNTSHNDDRNSVENRSTRSRTLRSRSRPPSPSSRNRMTSDDTVSGKSTRDQTPLTGSKKPQDHPDFHSAVPDSESADPGKENPPSTMMGAVHTNGEDKSEVSERRKAQTAARDIMVKLAMQREEAMDTEDAR